MWALVGKEMAVCDKKQSSKGGQLSYVLAKTLPEALSRASPSVGSLLGERAILCWVWGWGPCSCSSFAPDLGRALRGRESIR